MDHLTVKVIQQSAVALSVAGLSAAID